MRNWKRSAGARRMEEVLSHDPSAAVRKSSYYGTHGSRVGQRKDERLGRRPVPMYGEEEPYSF